MESLNEFFGKHSLMCTTVMTTTVMTVKPGKRILLFKQNVIVYVFHFDQFFLIHVWTDCVDLSGQWSTYTIYGFEGIVTLSQTGCKGAISGLKNGPYMYTANGLEIFIDWQQPNVVKGSVNESVSEIILDNGITYKKGNVLNLYLVPS